MKNYPSIEYSNENFLSSVFYPRFRPYSANFCPFNLFSSSVCFVLYISVQLNIPVSCAQFSKMLKFCVSVDLIHKITSLLYISQLHIVIDNETLCSFALTSYILLLNGKSHTYNNIGAQKKTLFA